MNMGNLTQRTSETLEPTVKKWQRLSRSPRKLETPMERRGKLEHNVLQPCVRERGMCEGEWREGAVRLSLLGAKEILTLK